MNRVSISRRSEKVNGKLLREKSGVGEEEHSNIQGSVFQLLRIRPTSQLWIEFLNLFANGISGEAVYQLQMPKSIWRWQWTS